MGGLKALILVGGYGTRLRPLTLSYPKPIIPFCNKPMVVHQIEALARAGVAKVILAISYQADQMYNVLSPYASELDIEIVYSLENEPLGTAGPIAFAKSLLLDEDSINEFLHDEPSSNDPSSPRLHHDSSSTQLPFFVLNSDIVSNFPFKEALEFHYCHKAEGTLLVTTVAEPQKYGVVLYDQKTIFGGPVQQFVEKPLTYVGNRINAGIYIFNPSIFSRIQPRYTSIETEIFPAMCQEQQLYAFELSGFWMDIGQPKDYLTGMIQYLKHIVQDDKIIHEKSKDQTKLDPIHSPKRSTTISTNGFDGYLDHIDTTPRVQDENLHAMDDDKHPTAMTNGQCQHELSQRNWIIIEPVMIHPSSRIGSGCEIGPSVVIGPNCIIDQGVRIKRSCIMENCRIKSYAWIDRTIVGWHSTIGRWTRLDNVTVLGMDVTVGDELVLNGAKVLPHKQLNHSIMVADTIIM